ncbi:presenilins-associated rhomboid-like protein, mitochondrial isoform X2 [Cimex lectularius]|uniref:rhomboid protease n=1 Tax=Cimex lectularius TaxID=79782 RepID=A0A8I6S0C7_CIMLE|nr:presenilins-associated rhomboid-like protein, mitochondrial isoform X2 [Cimex lectularius]
MLLRTAMNLEGHCFRLFESKAINSNGYWLRMKFKKFSTSSTFNTRGQWSNKPKLESFQPQFDNVNIDTRNLTGGRLIKPFFFTLAFSTASISGAAIWHYENTRPNYFKDWKSSDRAYKYRHRNFWSDLNSAAQIFLPICLANILVFLAWRVPQLEYTMIKYFCSNPAAKNNCWPMVLSTFSHHSFLHIFANMYVLQSFCTAATLSMGKEQFLGFYMAAGAVASFASYVHKVIASKPGLSLGASGAIMGILGYTCVTYPDIQLSIILLPFFTFKAGLAIKVIMGLDLAGVLLGWRFFDHAAHLGGAAFGIFWGLWGNQHIWQKREIMVKYWRDFKKKI